MNEYSEEHPHEPEIPPTLDKEGRCLICTLLTRNERLLFIAEHLFGMVPRQVWLDSGGDDGQGHYEGDHRAAQLQQELKSFRNPNE